MKKYSYLGKSLAAFLALFLISCESFIPDPVDPRLSMYTEDGLNVSSALVNGKPWKAEPEFYANIGGMGFYPHHELTYLPENDTLYLDITGKIDAVPSMIRFVFTGWGITDLKELYKLNSRKILFNGESMYALYKGAKSESGQIYFKHVNESDTMAVLSGTFGFTTNNPSTKISYGRFDIRIRKEYNFWVKTDF